MARQKQATPLKRTASDFADARRESPAPEPLKSSNGSAAGGAEDRGGASEDPAVRKALAAVSPGSEGSGVMQLVVCIGGIYASL